MTFITRGKIPPGFSSALIVYYTIDAAHACTHASTHVSSGTCTWYTIDAAHMHSGSTDPLIIIMVLEHHGVSREQALQRLPEVEKVMVDYFVANSANAAEGIEILPGVAEVLQRLKVRKFGLKKCWKCYFHVPYL